MNQNITIFAKIAGKSFLKWFIIVALGLFITSLFFIIAIVQNIHLAGGGHGNAMAFAIGVWAANTSAAILIFGAPVFVFLYFMLANKIAIQNTIYLVWKNKAGDFIMQRMKSIIDKITNKNDKVSSFSDAAVLRMRLLDANRTEVTSSSIQRKVLNYVFNKIQLENVDFKDENLKLSDVITGQLNTFVTSLAQPSFLFFWLLFGLQLVLFIVSQFYK